MNKKLILNILLIFFIILLIYSLINIITWFIDANKTDEQIQKLQDIAQVEETDEIQVSEKLKNEENSRENISTKMMKVDFTELKKINPDVVGWIKVNGTNIDYPFVQASNNEFYLDHSFDKTYNKAGWVFLDYKNSKEELDKNTILYAHNRKDGTMFETLKNVITDEWLQDQTNHLIKLSMENKNTIWKVFSAYTIPTTDDYLKINFNSDEEFEYFVKKIKDRSVYDFNTKVTVDDKILTLSSCYINSQKRIVLHAKLLYNID